MTINRNNYEEYFLLYTDRELNREEQLMVEDFVRLHPDLEKEFNLLKQTIALPPVVIFEGKEKLLKEERKKRVLPVYWLRIAASLLIVLAGAWFWLMLAGKTGRGRESNNPASQAAIRQGTQKSPDPGVAAISSGSQKDNRVPGTTGDSGDSGVKKATINPSNKEIRVNRKEEIAKTEGVDKTGRTIETQEIAKTQRIDKTGRITETGGIATTERITETGGVSKKEKTMIPANLPDKRTYTTGEENAGQENVVSATNPSNSHNATLLPELNQANQPGADSPAIHPPSTVNRQPSTKTAPPSTLPDDSQSILVFNNNNKAVPGFFKKLLSGSSDEGVAADNRKRKIKISVFQFNLSK